MLQQRVELETPYGRVEVVALRPSNERLPTVLVNVGCYYTLADSWSEMVEKCDFVGTPFVKNTSIKRHPSKCTKISLEAS